MKSRLRPSRDLRGRGHERALVAGRSPGVACASMADGTRRPIARAVSRLMPKVEARVMIDGKPRSVYARTEGGAIAKVNGLRLRLAQGLDTSSAERIERWQHEMEGGHQRYRTVLTAGAGSGSAAARRAAGHVVRAGDKKGWRWPPAYR